MAHFHSNALIGASGGEITEPPGNRSIRFNSGDSAHFSKTFSSAGNRDTWTWSAWIKITDFSASDPYNFIFGAGASDEFYICQRSSQEIHIRQVTGGSEVISLITDQEFRDVGGWGHLVVAVDTGQATSSNRIKVYWNGSQITSFSTSTYPSQNLDTHINNNVAHYIGKRPNGSIYLDAYLTDVYFIDGSQLSPTSFGAFNSNGVWQRGTYSGSYGTNGFHILDFANEAEIGGDSSGNANDFTPNNISDTDGVGLDLLLDFPTNGSETDTGAGGEVVGNYCTMNSLHSNGTVTFSNGNLNVSNSSGWWSHTGTIGVNSGKWYYEVQKTSGTYIGVGWRNDATPVGNPSHNANGGGIYFSHNGNKQSSAGNSSYGATFGNSDVIGVALDRDAGTITFYKNGSSQGQAFTGMTDGFFFPEVQIYQSAAVVNFGQRPFTHNAPSNHKALCTANLPTPTIADGSDYFDQLTYVGNESSRSITGLSFSPDLVIVKNRERSAYNHYWVDNVRGGGRNLYSNSNEAEHVADRITTLDSAGFTLSSHMGPNYSGEDYIAHCWDAGSSTSSNTNGTITSNVRVNTTAGFAIASYTGNGQSGATIGHGLGVTPEFWLLKDRDHSDMWIGRHQGVANTHYMEFNATFQARNAISDVTGDSDPTSTVIPVGSADTNNNGRSLIAYIWAPVSGFSAAPFWTGNGSSDGVFIYLGFRPKAFWFKRTDSAANWYVYDSTRSTSNPVNKNLEWNTADAENVLTSMNVDFLSNGVKVRGSDGDINASSGTYLGFAWAENPFQANGGLAR